MARIRSIKPEIWSDPDFVERSPMARILFVASWNFATDYGVLPDKPLQLKMQCLPGDNVDATPLVEELVDAGFYVRRTHPDGSKVLVIRTFHRNQRVDKPHKGRWGDPAEWDDEQEDVVELPPPHHEQPQSHPIAVDDDSPNVPGTIAEPSPLDWNGIGVEGNGSREPIAHSATAHAIARPSDEVYEAEFTAWWSGYPRKEDRKKALRCWVRLRKAGTSVVELTNARDNYVVGNRAPSHKYAATFLGPDEPWRDWVTSIPDVAESGSRLERRRTSELGSALADRRGIRYDDDPTPSLEESRTQ